MIPKETMDYLFELTLVARVKDNGKRERLIDNVSNKFSLHERF